MCLFNSEHCLVKMCSATRPNHRTNAARGFAYLALLIALAIMGIAAAASIQLGSILQHREAEEQLLLIGKEFQSALISYANATPPGTSSAPATLEDLLKDPRYPMIRRHLRNIAIDPLTGKATWGTLVGNNGTGNGIIGIMSLSTATPIKIANFDPDFHQFEGKTSYADWIFMIPPQFATH